MKELPRLRLAHLPTPIEPMPRLSAELGGPRLLVKRDDQTGLALGGNKTRKLEFLVADAQAQGAQTLITAGACQSNHCRQTAAAAARFGFKCILILTPPPGQIDIPISSRAASGNLLLDHLFKAKIIWAQRAEREQALQDTFKAAREAGERPYLIPYGGSNPIGACAYALAIQELLQQGVDPDWIVFASSSGGTQAGLVVGKKVLGCQAQILGISVDETADVLKERVASLATETAAILGEKYTFSAEEIQVNSDYLGGGYGIVGEAEKETLPLFARTEGLLLDPVYTARAAAGLVDLIRKGFFARDQTVLFWHTGGTPALFADPYSEIISSLSAHKPR